MPAFFSAREATALTNKATINFAMYANLPLPTLVSAALWLVAPTVASMLPDGVISLPLQRIKNQSAYGLELEVGNPPQRVVSLVDTGSPTYSFESIRKTSQSSVASIAITG